MDCDLKQNERYEICKSCDRFNNILKICKECGCFMPAKIKIELARCPLDKWTIKNIKGYK